LVILPEDRRKMRSLSSVETASQSAGKEEDFGRIRGGLDTNPERGGGRRRGLFEGLGSVSAPTVLAEGVDTASAAWALAVVGAVSADEGTEVVACGERPSIANTGGIEGRARGILFCTSSGADMECIARIGGDGNAKMIGDAGSVIDLPVAIVIEAIAGLRAG
jgi:hypothetical protein